ncbi:amidoligase family protein [Paenibacillus mendelii]|uniref:Amidoligase family protein n=1 Tax=Paenibacillus mendelii TaxID=206163 RepID=A0ABV6J9I8_9BACL|nr:amidoligase family protein [Paenibacillus mendelii]MCQ6559483.1 amidoligase family protein [Paenibacillus mendelii]
MWPRSVDWKALRFGVEIEFIDGSPKELELLPDWVMSLDELQLDETGADSGSELKPPPILWRDREQIRMMLTRLQAQGASANWSCGLHVHVGLEPWGDKIILPLIDAALRYQETIQALVQTSAHRLIFCPPVTHQMRREFMEAPSPEALRHRGRPQSHRCGINIAAWFDIGTVEFRFANGSLDFDEVIQTI